MRVKLESIPKTLDLQRAYGELQGLSPVILNEERIARYIRWSRFDSRLAEILVSYFVKNWRKLNPVQLNEALSLFAWGAAAGVLLEFAFANLKKSSDQLPKFKLWSALVMEGLPMEDFQLYFIGLQPLGGKSMREDAQYSLSEYKKWGFLGREVLLNKASFQADLKLRPLDKEVRQQKIKQLMDQHFQVNAKMYWKAVCESISLRQAERDLKSCEWLESFGQTKGRMYRLRSNKS